jgi:hypothetical protein
MTHEMVAHYTCDYCKADGMDRNNGADVKSWIQISNGSGSFHHNNHISIRFMIDNYEKDITHNLHFCSKECLVRFMLKHLGTRADAIDNVTSHVLATQDMGNTKKSSRFSEIDLVVSDPMDGAL